MSTGDVVHFGQGHGERHADNVDDGGGIRFVKDDRPCSMQLPCAIDERLGTTQYARHTNADQPATAAPVSVFHAQPVSQLYAAPVSAFHTPGPVFHALPASAPYAPVSTFDAPAPV